MSKTEINALYSGCIFDPWKDIAVNLKEQYNINPAYWIAWNENNELDELKQIFPDIVTHNITKAWLGIPETDINEYIDTEIIENILPEIFLTIKMMDRYDRDLYSFNFNERYMFAIKLIKYWRGILKKYNIRLFVSAVAPHRVFDFIIYTLCKQMGIKTIIYTVTPFRDLLLLYDDDIFGIPWKVKETYKEYLSKDIEINLKDEIKEVVARKRASYNDAEPFYMKNQHISTYENIKLYTNKAFSLLQKPQKIYYKFSTALSKSNSYYKNRHTKIEDSNISKLNVRYKQIKGYLYKNNLKKYYQKLTINPDLSKPYILATLHYQPEMTSNPLGRFFVEQYLMIEALAKYLPENWKIYVKEHKSQFVPFLEGETGRMKRFYDDIKEIKGVELIPCEMNPFELIDNSKAVATITGTIGFEAILRGKPAIVFGSTWYNESEGIYQVKTTQDLKQIYDSIKNNVEISEEKIDKYLQVISDVAISAYHYKVYNSLSKKTKKESVDAITSSIISYLKYSQII